MTEQEKKEWFKDRLVITVEPGARVHLTPQGIATQQFRTFKTECWKKDFQETVGRLVETFLPADNFAHFTLKVEPYQHD